MFTAFQLSYKKRVLEWQTCALRVVHSGVENCWEVYVHALSLSLTSNRSKSSMK